MNETSPLLHMESEIAGETQSLVVWREGLTEIFSAETAGTGSFTLRFAAMNTQFQRLSPPALCALIAAVGGLLGGATAVHGLRQNHYGPIAPPMLISHQDGVQATDSSADGGYADNSAAGCTDCSERDLGYRWATLAQVRSSDQCPNDSWGFRRGCLDYTGGV